MTFAVRSLQALSVRTSAWEIYRGFDNGLARAEKNLYTRRRFARVRTSDLHNALCANAFCTYIAMGELPPFFEFNLRSNIHTYMHAYIHTYTMVGLSH